MKIETLQEHIDALEARKDTLENTKQELQDNLRYKNIEVKVEKELFHHFRDQLRTAGLEVQVSKENYDHLEAYRNLETALWEWMVATKAAKFPVNSDMITEQGRHFFKNMTMHKSILIPRFSASCLNKFKRRIFIKRKAHHGEFGSADLGEATQIQMGEIRVTAFIYLSKINVTSMDQA